ncbi:MAG TPA: flagellar FliJ family protein [Phycisphaerae bacterium]|nr:flagellar FliJ family protein [Phycisphaerae bacterium]HRY69764.1 flagellar FliJ family protein [Phycisphaerae bacterium]HSA29240.1 flagellar FliJ family protein [Phycisphaerae bacterium]
MAKRFKFRFETMLRIRRQREDERKRIVAGRLREIRNLQNHMASLEKQIHDELRAIRIGRQPGTIDMQQIIRHRQWLGGLHKGVLEGQAKARFLEAELARERADLAEAAKQRRILEKLKERQWEQHRGEQDRVEALAADDLTTVRYVFDQQVGAS